jgi:hypothetical protein
MRRHFLIDYVCLWAARVFAALNILLLVYVAQFAFAPARLHRWTLLDSVRACELFAMVALSIVWVVSLWTLRNNTSRLFVGLSALLYSFLLIWSVSRGSGFADLPETAFTVVAFAGLPSMIWVALRPPAIKALNL